MRPALPLKSSQVQEWVNSIPADDGGLLDHKNPDSLLDNNRSAWTAGRTHEQEMAKETLLPSKVVLAGLRSKQSSFNSETSCFSSSSVDSLLEARREDPEELLLALGFGASPRTPLGRVPKRFLTQPSAARGILARDCFVAGAVHKPNSIRRGSMRM
ncbi:protein ITPRID2-like isoform X2 [Ornithodoros turicata]|uniref:protein ITPRID2-like isoform X2 n=1 Tax=Ornithodoros turicata TaxID=34597 RepID=UPI003139D93D